MEFIRKSIGAQKEIPDEERYDHLYKSKSFAHSPLLPLRF